MFSVYLFLVVVGAFCEITALVEVGEYAFDILDTHVARIPWLNTGPIYGVQRQKQI